MVHFYAFQECSHVDWGLLLSFIRSSQSVYPCPHSFFAVRERPTVVLCSLSREFSPPSIGWLHFLRIARVGLGSKTSRSAFHTTNCHSTKKQSIASSSVMNFAVKKWSASKLAKDLFSRKLKSLMNNASSTMSSKKQIIKFLAIHLQIRP